LAEKNLTDNEDHGYISPSGLEIIYHCPGSVNLCKNIVHGPERERVSSPAAERGTMLHEVVRKFVVGEEVSIPEDGSESVLWCLQRIKSIMDQLTEAGYEFFILTEHKLDLRSIGILPSKHGCRADLIIVVPNLLAYVIDYKFGTYYVPPVRYNWQFKAYCYGAYEMFGVPVTGIKLQPEASLENYRFDSWSFSEDAMVEVGASIIELVNRTNATDAPLVRGNQCTFCRAKATCPLHRGIVLEIPQHVTINHHLQNIDPIGRTKLYNDLVALKKWTDSAIDNVYACAMEGMAFDKTEIVDKTGNRVWNDHPSTVINRLREIAIALGKNPDDVVVPESPISPSQAESLFGKSKKVKDVFEGMTNSPVTGKRLKLLK